MLRGLVAVAFFVGTLWPFSALARVPDDEYFSEQWYLHQINAEEAWDHSLGLETIPVAVIDSGIDLDHPDLKDNIWVNYGEVPRDGIDNDGNGYIDDTHGWDFVDHDNDPNPVLTGDFSYQGASHGTISAGLVSAKGDNGIGVVGMAWQAPIMALRALDSKGTGDPEDVARAVDYAVRNGARVINLSFDGPVNSFRLASSLQRAYEAGVFVVAAAGNAPDDGVATNLDREPMFPICFDREASENYVYGVGSTDVFDLRSVFSNYGAACVDISAPGERVVSTQLPLPGSGDYEESYGGYFKGTSLAAPLVSGLAALMLSLDSHLTPKQVGNIMAETSVKIDQINPEYVGRLGRGRIDAGQAVRKVVDMQRRPIETYSSTASLAPPGSSGRYVVTAAGSGRDAEVRLFTEDGVFVRTFEVFPGFEGGLSLDIGNFDGSRRSSIVVGAGPGGGPHVRIFDLNTKPIGGFFAYDSDFRGGVEVATGDLDGDGLDEIVTGAGPGGGPHVRIFDRRGNPQGGFFALDSNFRGGIDVAAGDLDGDGLGEIVVGSGSNSPLLEIYSRRGQLLASVRPFGDSYGRGMQVEIKDIDSDGQAEIVVQGRTADGQAQTAIIDGDGELLSETKSLPSFYASLSDLSAGNERRLNVWGVLPGEEPAVFLSGQKGDGYSFLSFEPAFRGGVQARLTD